LRSGDLCKVVFNIEIDSLLLTIFAGAVPLFFVWEYTRWVAGTAEKAGRSYLAFMFLAIIVPIIAWLIVIMFKKPEVSTPTPTDKTP